MIGIGVLQAIAVAVVLSIIDVVRRAATPGDAVLGYSEPKQLYSDVSGPNHFHGTIAAAVEACAPAR